MTYSTLTRLVRLQADIMARPPKRAGSLMDWRELVALIRIAQHLRKAGW